MFLSIPAYCTIYIYCGAIQLLPEFIVDGIQNCKNCKNSIHLILAANGISNAKNFKLEKKKEVIRLSIWRGRDNQALACAVISFPVVVGKQFRLRAGKKHHIHGVWRTWYQKSCTCKAKIYIKMANVSSSHVLDVCCFISSIYFLRPMLIHIYIFKPKSSLLFACIYLLSQHDMHI